VLEELRLARKDFVADAAYALLRHTISHHYLLLFSDENSAISSNNPHPMALARKKRRFFG
jgi:hypothetical protein